MGRFGSVELRGLTLTGPRLQLRPWHPADADRVHQALRDPEMHRYLVLPDPYTRDDAEHWVVEDAPAVRDEGTGLSCALVETASGRLVGSALLRLGPDPEIGYWVAPDARGVGYAAEAVRTLADWAFGVGVRRILIACDVRNLASARTALAAGFRYEGISRDGILGGGYRAVLERRADLARFARVAGDDGAPVRPTFTPLPEAGLSDGVLALRAAGPQDAAGFEQTDDAESVHWGFTGVPRGAAVARARTAQAGLDWLVGPAAAFAMVDVATGRYAGDLTLRLAGPPGVGNIGYGVHPDFRGRGYTARALRLLVPWAFGPGGFGRLELGAKVGNLASQRAAVSGGFQPDGVLSRRLRNADGTFADEARFALVR